MRLPPSTPARPNPAHPSTLATDMEGLVDDVTSHLSASVPKHYATPPSEEEEPLRVSLLHNPSHLEIIGCVAAGNNKASISSCLMHQHT